MEQGIQKSTLMHMLSMLIRLLLLMLVGFGAAFVVLQTPSSSKTAQPQAVSQQLVQP